ncbi:MAG: hypothetical protein ABW039_00195 [Sphingobium sp.]
MSVSVDDLREVLLAETDMRLAEKLGLERSTIAQWRKRGVPKRYHFLMEMRGDPQLEARDLAARRRIFGDGDGGFIMEAAIGFVPLAAFDMPSEFTPGAAGYMRMETIMVAARYILDVLGDRRCETTDDYIALLRELDSDGHADAIAGRIGPFLPV